MTLRPPVTTVVAAFGCAAIVSAASVNPAGQAGQTPPQIPPPVFRAGIDVVQVDVSVLDRDHRPVRHLTVADFTVLEEGRPQEIVVFAPVDIPTVDLPATPWIREAPPDVRTNDLGDARLFAIIMDDAATPADMQLARSARAIGHRIIDEMRPADLAAVIFTRDNRHAQDFTTERARLRAAVDRFQPGVIYGVPGMGQIADSYSYMSSILTLNRVTEYLGSVPQRRKTVIYVSSGVPVDLAEASSIVMIGPGVSMAEHDLAIDLADALRTTDRVQSGYAIGLRDLLVRAQHGNVAVYSIDPGGLGGLQFYLQNRAWASAPSVPTSPGANAQLDGLQRASLHRDYLRTVADNSGGRAILDTNDLGNAVAGIFRENSSYYLLGYRSTRETGDRRARRVDVRVNRPGAIARTRNAYYDPRARPVPVAPDPSLVLKNALTGILPHPDLSLRATVAPFAVPGEKTMGVAIVLGVRQPVPRGDPGARVLETVELLTGAFTPAGDPRGSFRQTAQVRMRAGVSETAQFDLLTRIDLPPGRYQLRLAAHSTAIDKSGSIYYDVDVPDFAGAQMQLSGVVLAVTPGPLAAPADALTGLTPLVPTSQREFNRTDALRGFVQIYAGGRLPSGPIGLTARITDEHDQVVHRVSEPFARDRFDPARIARHLFEIPLARLNPGRFLLTVEAAQSGRTVRRDVPFGIR